MEVQTEAVKVARAAQAEAAKAEAVEAENGVVEPPSSLSRPSEQEKGGGKRKRRATVRATAI